MTKKQTIQETKRKNTHGTTQGSGGQSFEVCGWKWKNSWEQTINPLKGDQGTLGCKKPAESGAKGMKKTTLSNIPTTSSLLGWIPVKKSQNTNGYAVSGAARGKEGNHICPGETGAHDGFHGDSGRPSSQRDNPSPHLRQTALPTSSSKSTLKMMSPHTPG